MPSITTIAVPRLDLLLLSAATSSPTPSSFSPAFFSPSSPCSLLLFFSCLLASPSYLSCSLLQRPPWTPEVLRSESPTHTPASLPTSSPRKTIMPAAGASSRPRSM
ncbi:hypothetical protein VPH35_043098 [Triticum aestivum]